MNGPQLIGLASQAFALLAVFDEARAGLAREAPGISVFIRNTAGEVFHPYSCYSRGLDMLNGAYHFLDLVPKGRDEAQLADSMAWLRHHDRYED